MKFDYRAEVEAAAAAHHLDADLVQAMCQVESNGNTKAYRYEPAFWLRYMAMDPRWKNCEPTQVSASYGLMQVMYLVAIEFGFPATHPPEQLYIPSIGLEYGCRVLAERVRWVNKAAADVSAETRLRAALASYNGGKGGNAADHRPDRNAQYAEKVLRALSTIQAKRLS